MQTSQYLFFNGQCEAAFKFYEQCLGGKMVALMTYADIPAESMQCPLTPEMGKLIVHARLIVGTTTLLGGDAPPERYCPPAGFTVSLGVETPAEAERIFAALADGGTIEMPMEKTFWAERFGMVAGRFGTPWMVSCEGGK